MVTEKIKNNQKKLNIADKKHQTWYFLLVDLKSKPAKMLTSQFVIAKSLQIQGREIAIHKYQVDVGENHMSTLGYALNYFFSIYIYKEGDGENGVSTRYSKTTTEMIDE